ncbi:MAG: aliphatic sulfonate ABC transporter substrate-binding protein [Alphaproteobacteria bacterium]
MSHDIGRRKLIGGAVLALGLAAAADAPALAQPEQVVLDWAYYNPVSLLLLNKGWVEEEFAKDGIDVAWIQSHGSNKAIEFLNSGGLDFGSTAGAAALLAHINGSEIQSIYVYSKPEWTALVTRPDTGIATVEDLKGHTVAVTRGTDPYIFLLRALAEHGLSEADIEPVLLQHADGGNALLRGDVDAWAGLDPMMAAAELESGAVLFYRNADLNTYGTLNVRTAFAEENPEIVLRVIRLYERGREYALAHPDELRDILRDAAGLTDAVAERQLSERTDLSAPFIGQTQIDAITAAGVALQGAGIIEADVDVAGHVQALINPSYGETVAAE